MSHSSIKLWKIVTDFVEDGDFSLEVPRLMDAVKLHRSSILQANPFILPKKNEAERYFCLNVIVFVYLA